MNLKDKMIKELEGKEIFEQARKYAFEYLDDVDQMKVFPSEENLQQLSTFEEPLPDNPVPASDILEQLHTIGSPTTIAQTGGKYFGFVNGNVLPVSLATKWLTDVWDQCGGLYIASPINAQMESICETWLKDIFNLPDNTVAGFVSGTSMANLSGLAAARYRVLQNLGWDVNKNGLNGSPKIRIIAHEAVHASIHKTLAILGFGSNNMEVIPIDNQGRIDVNALPPLDNSCIVLLQAGNVNTGAYDDFATVCPIANKAGAWVHIDGAFGLWASACKDLAYLTKGIELADSWAVDGHKTLNTPYDSGIVLCSDAEALVNALKNQGKYLIFSDQRDPMFFGPEMSKRARAIELWACMKYLGKSGIDEMITGFNTLAKQLGKGLQEQGFHLHNEIVFNQVLVSCETEEWTQQTIKNIQATGDCWCGGTVWKGKPAIRISICSWKTNTKDIEEVIQIFATARKKAMMATKG